MELYLGEKIKDITGYEGIYAVTTLGRVWGYPSKGRNGGWLKINRTKTQYIQVGLTDKENKSQFKYVHQLVARAFIPNPYSKKQVNHIDGNKYNCRISNLEWVTARENIQHATDAGLHSCHKLSYEQKIEICKHRQSGVSVKRLTSMYDISESSVRKALKAYMDEYIQSSVLAA
ncbi:MAG TPA: HNH endonuclease signature motif containing protein [Saprospiraceae bacterium]|nr:HNH endonuclease signature motif containing protein [Saprospiraceae bacterium]